MLSDGDPRWLHGVEELISALSGDEVVRVRAADALALGLLPRKHVVRTRLGVRPYHGETKRAGTALAHETEGDMVTFNKRAWHRRSRAWRRRSRRRIDLLRRSAIGAAAALAVVVAATGPASAAAGNDGTSNTIEFTVASTALDQVHHRVLVAGPAGDGLAAGSRVATAEVETPRYTIILNDALVSSLVGTSSSLALNYTTIKYKAFGRAPCVSGVDACLIEDDGIWLPGG
jgi:hypothetical protein